MTRATYYHARWLWRTSERMARQWYAGYARHSRRAATYAEYDAARRAVRAIAGVFDFFATRPLPSYERKRYQWRTRATLYPYGTQLPLYSDHNPPHVTPYLIMVRKHFVEHGVALDNARGLTAVQLSRLIALLLWCVLMGALYLLR